MKRNEKIRIGHLINPIQDRGGGGEGGWGGALPVFPP